MNNILKQFISFVLPFFVLILVPTWIEKDLSVKNGWSLFGGLFLILGGLYIMFKTISLFIRIGKGTLAPWSPTVNLVTTGMYSHVRNPMITGVLIILTGESIMFLSLNILIWTGIFFVINTIYFLIYEEPNLRKRFGKEYAE